MNPASRRSWGLSLLAVLALAAAGAGHARAAAASDWAETEHGRVRLVAASATTGSGDQVRLGLQFEMRPGWKIYWRSPGDAGFPPSVDWTGSRNLKQAALAWPAPERFTVLGLTTLGYTESVVLPITATLAEPDRPLHVEALVNYLTCDDICVPYEARLALDLPAGPASPTPYAHLIDRFAQRVPGDGAAAGLAVESVAVRRAEGAETLVVAVQAREPLERPDLFVEGPKTLAFGPPRVELLEGGKRGQLSLPVERLTDTAPSAIGAALTLTLVDGARALEATATPAPAAPNTGGGSGIGLLAVLGLALVGGFILNFMPCVLPVLSIKLLSVVGHGGGERRQVRRRFLASAAGILASFLALAGALVALKAAGAAVGWGIQFQQPWFLIALVSVISLFAADMWGLVEFRLPSALADALARPGALPGAQSPGLTGDFLTGAFATLLATPCSAPFLGTAVGFALARGAGEIALVFAMLGLGLALPYLLVAALPGIATRLPRPGPWMVRLKAVLGVALAATAIWLLSVLAAQEGVPAAVAVGLLMLALVAALWLRQTRPALGAGALAGAGVFVALAFALPALLPAPAPGSAAAAPAAGYWRPFDPDAIAGLVRQGKIVFVDVTADWCVTCQANEKLVLGRKAIAARLDAPEVVAMVADWTRPDDRIAAYLASFGRYGIPFNVVYGPRAPEGLPLPELLTEAAVLDALDRAGGRSAQTRETAGN
ncbi:MAG TPA: protein-disulfide reductase DsbD domain-containing protein [Alphaproteobacteria bacterium]